MWVEHRNIGWNADLGGVLGRIRRAAACSEGQSGAGDAGTAAALDIAADALEADQPPSEPPSDPDANAEPMIPVPDTADQLIDAWEGSEAIEEVDIGELGEAGITLEDVGG